MEKRTDKIKKKTFGGFYSEFAKWNPKGKSSVEKDLMIEDLKNCVKHQLTRIKKLKYVIDKLKEERDERITIEGLRKVRSDYKRKVINEKNKVSTRDKILDVKLNEIVTLEKAMKTKERDITRLLKSVEKKDAEIKEANHRKKSVIVKEVEKPLTPSAKRLEKIASKPLDERVINVLDNTVRIVKFAENNRMQPVLLSIILQIETEGSLRFSESLVGTRMNFQKLVDDELITYQLTKQIKNYYLTVKGKDLVKELKNFISNHKQLA